MNLRPLMLVGALWWATPAAHAQFVGDVFAKAPSVSGVSGSDVTVEVQLFSGANVFGASIVDVSYVPGELAVKEVALSAADGSRRTVAARKLDGRVEIGTVSLDATANPIGTVTLAHITFTVLAQPGRVVTYRMTPREMLMQDERRYASTRGAAGEIAVVNTLTGTRVARTASAALPVVADASSLSRAAEVRPRGGAVQLVTPTLVNGQIVPQTVQVVPPRRGTE
ncbi:cohesin domain-containing protein [Aquincola tertiaricarbonis]|uniref:Cohesin domain-containing protein n=1 Tax=Aquincola tertiaricarbonis TaxID=391953 RepID=A0ABY4S4P9_AQUTE|nr:cohesin domain-containing protein [Aquincola tertiaricarbonis]URI06852.1 cohesin domain-containing protein [Aquincola tertiaricarbonis]